jgi:hypothetical protein
MQINYGAGAITITGTTPAQDFSISLAPVSVVLPAPGVAGTLRDADTLTQAASQNETMFSVQLQDAPGDGTVVANLTPGIATFAGSAVAAYVSDGLAQVQATHPTLGTRVVEQRVQRTMVGVVEAFTGYRPGIAADVSAQIDAALAVGASSGTTQRFSALANNTRNAARWWASLVDDTAITREPAGFTLAVLVGPRHVLGASHLGLGGPLGWGGSDGVGYVGTVAGAGAALPGTDISLWYIADATAGEIAAYNAANPKSQPAAAVLSAGVGLGVIRPFAMLPAAAWAAGACPLPLAAVVISLANARAVPSFHTTRGNAVGVWDLTNPPSSWLYVNGITYPNEFQISQPSEAARAPFAAAGTVGTTASGDITFLGIPAGSAMAASNPGLGAGYPVLLGCTHGSPGGAVYEVPWVAGNLAGIAAAMQATAQAAGDPLWAGYAPTVVSLAGYASY